MKAGGDEGGEAFGEVLMRETGPKVFEKSVQPILS